MTYLTLQDLLDIVEALGVGPVRDIGLLDSSVARPRSEFFGVQAYATLELKAASLMHSLCRNHSLVDGQKRLALTATLVFLRLNGARAQLSQDAAHDLTLEVAAGLDDLDEIARRMHASQ